MPLEGNWELLLSEVSGKWLSEMKAERNYYTHVLPHSTDVSSVCSHEPFALWQTPSNTYKSPRCS